MTEDNKPGNIQVDLNNGGWTFIGILIAIIIVLIAVIVIIYIRKSNIIDKLREFQKQSEVSDEERDLLTEYRKLNSRDKNVIISTISSLNENNQPSDTLTKEQEQGRS